MTPAGALPVRAPVAAPVRRLRPRPWGLFWLAALALSLLLAAQAQHWLPKWALDYPRRWAIPVKTWVNELMRWLLEDASFGWFTVKELTRGIAWLLDWPLTAATNMLASGLLSGQGSAAVQLLPPLPWIAVVYCATALGHYAGGRRLALLVGLCFFLSGRVRPVA